MQYSIYYACVTIRSHFGSRTEQIRDFVAELSVNAFARNSHIPMPYDQCAYEIFLDEAMLGACLGGPIPWLPGEAWRAKGIDATLFPTGEIPMKTIWMESGENEHTIAKKYYAMAHCTGYVKGPPACRVLMKTTAGALVNYLWNGSMKIYPERQTLAITQTLDAEHYPDITCVLNPIDPAYGDRLLQEGYHLAGCPGTSADGVDHQAHMHLDAEV